MLRFVLRLSRSLCVIVFVSSSATEANSATAVGCRGIGGGIMDGVLMDFGASVERYQCFSFGVYEIRRSRLRSVNVPGRDYESV